LDWGARLSQFLSHAAEYTGAVSSTGSPSGLGKVTEAKKKDDEKVKGRKEERRTQTKDQKTKEGQRRSQKVKEEGKEDRRR